LTKVPSFKAFVGVLLIFVIGMPAMNQLVYWNENIRRCYAPDGRPSPTNHRYNPCHR
jgi:hypothetical protein